jgi:phosphoadenylyl-sulfate reductase (thioredoxin)
MFRRSPALRHQCCEVRKVRPLTRALAPFDAWITGVRRDQAATRTATPVVCADAAHHGMAKIAPLAGWTSDEVWRYIRANDVPSHALYEQHYTSIGCAPCTRATRPGEDARAGRWWWENDTVKECGLHWAAGGAGAVPVPIRAKPREDVDG